ncbi:putative oxidoreductase YqhD [Dickeya dianthicola RNS04.9]|nr:putative oxidoreductase YqhD [Dickeya dianthicola RNS04.9]
MQCAHRVWDFTSTDEERLISLAIEKTRDFFETMGVKNRIRDYNLSESAIDDILTNLDTCHLLPQGRHQNRTVASPTEFYVNFIKPPFLIRWMH